METVTYNRDWTCPHCGCYGSTSSDTPLADATVRCLSCHGRARWDDEAQERLPLANEQ